MKSIDGSITGPVARRRFLSSASSAVAASVAALASPRVQAQAYPAHPISFVVSYPPGSVSDLSARILASELTARLGQNVLVENKPGAGGSIGVAAVVRAKNDGYTLCLITTSTMTTAPVVYPDLPYDPHKDLAPMIMIGATPNVLLVPASSPITSVKDLGQRMKEAGKPFRYNSSGNGSAQHLEGALLAKLLGVTAEHVPYRGPAEQMIALMAGQVDFGFVAVPTSVTYVKDGRLRPLAITSTKPSAVFRDVPSFSSLGFADLDKTSVWFGVALRSGTPDAVMNTLHAAFASALSNPQLQSKFAALGLEPVTPMSPAEFSEFIRGQAPFWIDLLKSSGASFK